MNRSQIIDEIAALARRGTTNGDCAAYSLRTAQGEGIQNVDLLRSFLEQDTGIPLAVEPAGAAEYHQPQRVLRNRKPKSNSPFLVPIGQKFPHRCSCEREIRR